MDDKELAELEEALTVELPKEKLLEEPIMCNDFLLIKCKPTYNFQSVEFEFAVDLNKKASFEKMFKIYKYCLEEMMKFAPEQDKKSVAREPLASEKQKAIMDKFGIKYTDRTTTKEAQALIQKSIDEK